MFSSNILSFPFSLSLSGTRYVYVGMLIGL